MKTEPMTSAGLGRLEAELKRLKTIERPTIIKALSDARDMGDISENAEYHAAKERQAYIESRVAQLEEKISRAKVIDIARLTGGEIKFGATVALLDEDTDEKLRYQIVGVDEADIREGLLSIGSPLARALIGRSGGDTVEVTTPGGSKSYEILSVKFV